MAAGAGAPSQRRAMYSILAAFVAAGVLALVPKARVELKHHIARLAMLLSGWTFRSESALCKNMPDDRHKLPLKYVAFGEPHTSMKDFMVMLCFLWWAKVDHVRFMVTKKHFYPVMGSILTILGAVKVDPSRSGNITQQMVDYVTNCKGRCVLLIPPSGTRRKTEYWRSGFYYIALGAKVPVLPAFLDASKKEFGFADPVCM
mmetsp:Transcript_34692/g.77600  ORF Transcript_34692/g.77600 Transcript_34692/m.77600 type:complete len:202 (+) Transcript_34692:32-637(+)